MAKTARRLVITNDDGYFASGFKIMKKISEKISDDITVVAPEFQQSCKGHGITVHKPLRVTRINEKEFRVNGTPADCIFVAMNNLIKDNKPDLVLSGVNKGNNLGYDVHYSGTVSAAVEAVMRGIPAISLSSRSTPDIEVDWSVAEHYAPEIIKDIIAIGIPDNHVVNINFPACSINEVKGVKVVTTANQSSMENVLQRRDPYNRDYFWLGMIDNDLDGDVDDSSDVGAVSKNYIAVTSLNINMSNNEFRNILRGKLKNVI